MAEVFRCPICLKLNCDRHSLKQQGDALRGSNQVFLTESAGRIEGDVPPVPRRIQGKLTIRG